jgi:hypothetical protein
MPRCQQPASLRRCCCNLQLVAATGWVAEVYSYHNDADTITGDATKSFLQLLQHHTEAAAATRPPAGSTSLAPAAKSLVDGMAQAAASQAATISAADATAATFVDRPASQSPAAAAAAKANIKSSSSSNNSNSLDLTPFIRVAEDILSYLRFTRSRALLQLLREFSSASTVSSESVDPDQLQAEVQTLLQLQQLNAWYSYQASKDSTERHGAAVASGNKQQQRQQQRGRRLKQKQHLQGGLPAGGTASSRRLHSGDATDLTNALLSQMTGSAAPAPAGRTGSSSSTATTTKPAAAAAAAAAAAQGDADSSSQMQTLKDMLCGMRSWSPTGLDGVLSKPVDCSAARTVASAASLATFKPLVIPVVFHCECISWGCLPVCTQLT